MMAGRMFVGRRSWVVAAGVLSLVVGACAPTGGGGSGGTGGTGLVVTLPVGSETVTVAAPVGSTVTVTQAVAAGLPTVPAGLVFPFGAIAVDVNNVTPGGLARVVVSLSSPVDSVRKLINGSWDLFTFDGTTGASVSSDGLTITLDLQDGGRGDADGVPNGTIVDPFAPVTAISLTITSAELPTLKVGLPYSYQLVAAGETGTVHWSVLSGSLPGNVTLSDSGLLSSPMISATPGGGGPVRVRVQAVDDLNTATKMLAPIVVAASGQATSSGTPLPDGNRIFFGNIDTPSGQGPPSPFWLGFYQADGTISTLETSSINSLRTLGFSGVNPAGTRLVTYAIPTNGGPSTGPVSVVDADTGAPVATLESSPLVQLNEPPAFSPNGAYLALSLRSSGVQTIQIFETADWQIIRTLSGPSFPVWSPDSTELLTTLFPTPTAGSSNASVFSATDASGTSDRQLATNTQTCPSLIAPDWSPTGRVALLCLGLGGNSVVTISAADGSAARVFAINGGAALPRFSPNGQYLQVPDGVGQLGYVKDEVGASVTYLTLANPNRLALPFSWK